MDYSTEPATESLNAFKWQHTFKGMWVCREFCYFCEACVQRQREWDHHAWSWDSSTGEAVFYLNGEHVYNRTTDRGLWQTPLRENGCGVFGQEPDSMCGLYDELQSMDGILDEFRLWSRVRTAAEIKDNFRRYVDSSEPDLYHLFRYGFRALAVLLWSLLY